MIWQQMELHFQNGPHHHQPMNTEHARKNMYEEIGTCYESEVYGKLKKRCMPLANNQRRCIYKGDQLYWEPFERDHENPLLNTNSTPFHT